MASSSLASLVTSPLEFLTLYLSTGFIFSMRNLPLLKIFMNASATVSATDLATIICPVLGWPLKSRYGTVSSARSFRAGHLREACQELPCIRFHMSSGTGSCFTDGSCARAAAVPTSPAKSESPMTVASWEQSEAVPACDKLMTISTPASYVPRQPLWSRVRIGATFAGDPFLRSRVFAPWLSPVKAHHSEMPLRSGSMTRARCPRPRRPPALHPRPPSDRLTP